MTFTNFSTTNGWTCTESAGTVTCHDPGTGMSPGESAQITILASVNTSAAVPIANTAAAFEVIRREVTAERVKEHFRGFVHGRVERFEVPNLYALNFILHDSLGGGGTASLKTDAQGKTHGQGLLRLEIEVPEAVLAEARR